MHADGANARALAVTRGFLMRVAERTRENETGRVRAALRARECGGTRQAAPARKKGLCLGPRENVDYRRA